MNKSHGGHDQPEADDASDSQPRGRYFQVPNKFVDLILAHIHSGRAAKVAIVMLRYARHGKAWPSVSTVARMAGISRSAASRGISELVEGGFLVREAPGRGPRQTTKYRVVMEMRDSRAGATVNSRATATDSRATAHQVAAPLHTNSRASDTQLKPRQRPVDKDQDKSSARAYGTKLLPGLERFWSLLPQRARDRSSKKDCEAVWAKLNLESRAAAVIAGLLAWKTSRQWNEDGDKYIPGAHRWLKQEKFTEHPAQADPEEIDPANETETYADPDAVDKAQRTGRYAGNGQHQIA